MTSPFKHSARRSIDDSSIKLLKLENETLLQELKFWRSKNDELQHSQIEN